MNQPTLEQFNTLQKQYYELSAKVERLDQAEKRHDFTIRDSSVKIGIAEGLAKTTHHDISQLQLEMVELRAEMKELRATTDQHSEDIRARIDTLEVRFHQRLDAQDKVLRQILDKLE